MTDYSIFFIIAVVATGVGALLFLLSLFGLGNMIWTLMRIPAERT